MIIKQLDFLSPTVTFYYKGFLSHSSILSGILSVFSFSLIIIIAIYFSLELINREHPTVFYFNRFEEESGTFPINASSFFHFVSLSVNKTIIRDDGVDFRSFRIIGLEIFYPTYVNAKNLNIFDHWLYGYCNKEKDTKDLDNLINQSFFQNSACIRKYYNSKERKYYDTDDPNFRWPIIAHGTYKSDINKYYCIVIERCKEETVNLILNGENHCKTDEEVKRVLGLNSAAHLYFIDNYIDVLNYEYPNVKFFNIIENSIQIGKYPINHLNINPITIKTHNGLVLDNINKTYSYSFDRNDVIFYDDNNNTYTVYYLWLKNRMNYYERSYKRIQDVVSNIGGIFQFITFLAIFINRFYNNYIILYDTEHLLESSIDYEKRKTYSFKKKNNTQIRKSNEKIKDQKGLNKVVNQLNEKDNSKSKNFCLTNREEMININKIKKDEKNIDNANNKTINNKSNNFWQYVLFKLSFEKKNHSFKMYRNFRIKILSEEHLVRNHLNVYNLLRVNERKLISKKKYSYHLKDLINLV